jgi:2-oxoglutarate ferredoxin oxidoreductase subunit alpha
MQEQASFLEADTTSIAAGRRNGEALEQKRGSVPAERVPLRQSGTVRFELLMDAGHGAQKAGDVLARALSRSGAWLKTEPIIPAEISPPRRTPYSMSGVITRASGERVGNVGSQSDWMIVEHEILLERRLRENEYAPNCWVFVDCSDRARVGQEFDAALELARAKGLHVVEMDRPAEVASLLQASGGRGKNLFYLGWCAALLDLSAALVREAIAATFARASEEGSRSNLRLFELGHQAARDRVAALGIPPWANELADLRRQEAGGAAPRPTGAASIANQACVLVDGNVALANGIINAGYRFFSGYPITPASSIMHHLAEWLPRFGGVVHQAEDEIAAVGAVIGAYHVGTPAVTATSGPGLSLKQEFLGLASSAEIPCVVIDVQRGGPSTGLPTRTEQGDLFAAAFGGHGQACRVVLAVSDLEDCFYAPHVARYLAEKLRLPVIILSDYSLATNLGVIPTPAGCSMPDVEDISDDVLRRFGLRRLDPVEQVVQTRSVPGSRDGMRCLTGLNTDADGAVSYDADSSERGHAVRARKLEALSAHAELNDLFGEDEGELLIVAWGSAAEATREAVQAAARQGLRVAGLTLKLLHPLPSGLKQVFARFKRVVTVEASHGHAAVPTQLATLLRSETLYAVEVGHGRAGGRPVSPLDVERVIYAHTENSP